MSRELPVKPNLEHLKNQAKELLRQTRQNRTGRPTLAAAQLAIAREYGFASWPKLKRHVEALANAPHPEEALNAAVRASDAQAVAEVLERHPELKARLDDPLPGYGAGMQAILAAVQRSDRQTIDVLLRAGAGIRVRSHGWAGGIGVLDECAPALAPFLIERGTVVDAHSAARLEMIDLLRELAEADPAAVAARGANGQTPLHFASTVEIADYLLDRGAQIDAIDALHESTPAQHMLRVVQARHYPKDRLEIARRLVARGCRTDILMAAALGDLALVRRHLENDPECIRTRASEAWFPKQNPQSGGSIYFQQFGPDRTPHEIARDFGHEEVFRLLLRHTPSDLRREMAFELGDAESLRAALAAPGAAADLSEADRRRLPDAAQSNNAEAVHLLLEAGWPVDTRGQHHLSALDWAAWHGNAAMVREILRHHPPVEEKGCDFGIPAMGSALHGSMNSWHRDTGDYAATVGALLAAGAKAPELTEDLEASPAVREVLRRHAQPS